MRKFSQIAFISLSIATLPLLTSSAFRHKRCIFHHERFQSVHNKLKRLIQREMLRVPDNIDNKEKLKAIWYEGDYKTKIGRIISKSDVLTKKDLLDLKFLIIQEKKLLSEKIKKITKIINQKLFNQLSEALKFKKSEHEIEDFFEEEIEISEDKLIEQEYKTYDTILNQINKIINLNAFK